MTAHPRVTFAKPRIVSHLPGVFVKALLAQDALLDHEMVGTLFWSGPHFYWARGAGSPQKLTTCDRLSVAQHAVTRILLEQSDG